MTDSGISHKTGKEREYMTEGPVRCKDTDVMVMVFPPGQGQTDSTVQKLILQLTMSSWTCPH